MPLYLGGTGDVGTAKQVLGIGFEKNVVDCRAFDDPALATRLGDHFGNQAVIGSIDAKRVSLGGHDVYSRGGHAQDAHGRGRMGGQASGNRPWGNLPHLDGPRRNLGRLRPQPHPQSRRGVWIPVLANGGAGYVSQIGAAVTQGGASAVALRSMVVYEEKGMGVLVTFPDRLELDRALTARGEKA